MYIDAGTGSMLLQVIAASFFATLIFFKSILGFIRRLFARLRPARFKK